MSEKLPPDYEDKPIEVEGKHILLGLSFCLLGILAVGGGLIYYREGLKYRRQERLLETVLSVINLFKIDDSTTPKKINREERG